MWLTFRLDFGAKAPACVTVREEIVDPFYRDMEEGTRFFVEGDGFELTLPRKDWPPPDFSKPRQAILRFRYRHAVEGTKRGYQVEKVPAAFSA